MACLYGCDFSLALVILLHWGSQFGWPHKSLISKAQYCHASKGHHYPPESFHQFLLWLLHTSPLQQQLQSPALTSVLSFLDYATVAEKDDFRFLDDLLLSATSELPNVAHSTSGEEKEVSTHPVRSWKGREYGEYLMQA